MGLFLKCSCNLHALETEHFPEDRFLSITFWRSYVDVAPWWVRLKLAWRMVRGEDFGVDDVVLYEDGVEDLKMDLQKFLNSLQGDQPVQ